MRKSLNYDLLFKCDCCTFIYLHANARSISRVALFLDWRGRCCNRFYRAAGCKMCVTSFPPTSFVFVLFPSSSYVAPCASLRRCAHRKNVELIPISVIFESHLVPT